MIDLKTLLYYIILFGALAVPGYILGRCGRLRNEAKEGFSVILSNIAMPFLVLSKLLQADIGSLSALEILSCAIFPIILCFALLGLSSLFFKNDDKRVSAAEKFCAIFPNCGFLGIPLAAAIFPNDPKICVLVALFNVVSTFLLLTVGVYILSGERKHIKPFKVVLKPITIAMVAGILISVFGLSENFSGLAAYSDILASLTTPLAMLVLGAELSCIKFKDLFSCPALYGASTLKLLVSPLISFLLLVILKLFFGENIGHQLLTAIFISTGVSTAATAPAMARQYGADGKRAAILTLGSTIFCAITLPIMSLIFDILF